MEDDRCNRRRETDVKLLDVGKEKNILDNLTIDKNVTEEEFENFMHRVTEIDKIVKKLASSDPMDQEQGKFMADGILDGQSKREMSGLDDLRVITNRTVINKIAKADNQPDGQVTEKGAFMRSMEKDAKERAEDRKVRNERAETFRRIANGAFEVKNYVKAITYYSKALEQRKDSILLWNKRALTYMELGLFDNALQDYEWTLRLNDSNLMALLNSAKCQERLRNRGRSKELIELAKKRNPNKLKAIEKFGMELIGKSVESEG
ncbi:hsp70-Hsp90 organizing protein 1-like [Cephus cinctus]|uniref:Hsp70-Hsp90 organizing protein 1-like n=1 Tax=Cephus cinctus TaxID=211228 RepID=A0AAJ7CF59_CEPCN|nr:hsp70-Hsp90 organizing protein 1-like [Cephus cinctus]